MQHPGAHLGITRMKAPPHRKFLLRLSKQLGDAAWQKSVPPLSLWGGRLRWGWVCSPVWWESVFLCFCWCGPVNTSVSTYVHSALNLECMPVNFHNEEHSFYKLPPPLWLVPKKVLGRSCCVASLTPVCTYSVTLARMIQWQIVTW